MAAVESYDAVVLGSGEGGKSIAWHLGSAGPAEVAPLTHVEWILSCRSIC
jgi:choline dehydrogenase-like flavoprotein